MSMLNHILAIFVWFAVCSAVGSQSESVGGLLIAIPFVLGPHIVSHALCFRIRSRTPAVLLGIGMVAYVSWFFYVFIDAFHVHPDPQSPIVLVFVGFVSLPIMIPVWLVSLSLERKANDAQELYERKLSKR